MSDHDELKIPVFDGHNDTALHMANLGRDDGQWSFFERNDTGHIDLPRARQGGMFGGFFAIFAPHARAGGDKLSRRGIRRSDEGYSIPMAPALAHEDAREYTDEVLTLLEELVDHDDESFRLVRDLAELQQARDGHGFGAVLHFEGAEAIDEDLHRLGDYYDRGLRSLGLVWSRPNAFGHGVPFRFPCSPDTGPGLTEAGKQLVRACNELGIIVDMAHLNEAGFWDVERISDRPLVVSHACCHTICPSARNLTDRQLDAIAHSDGVVGINFFVGDLRDDGRFVEETPLDQIVRHIDYVVDRIGIDHVAFGSDFDGARVPAELADCTGFPLLLKALQQRGYDGQSLARIAHGNWLRVIEATWTR